MDGKLLAMTLREEVKFLRQEMNAVMVKYLEKIDHLSTEARRLENEYDDSSTADNDSEEFSDRSIRVQSVRNEDTQ